MPAYAKNRETIAKRGYTYARAEFLVRDNDGRNYERGYTIVRRLGMPTEDEFGEKIINV